jgi:hypothetical protein
LGLKEGIDDVTQLVHTLHRALLTEHECGRQVVLVIDEAHTLSVDNLASLVRLISPQGKVRPDPTGRWTVESVYASPGYRYATFLVITTNPASVALLQAQQSRKYGLRALPPSTEHLGTAIVVMRE